MLSAARAIESDLKSKTMQLWGGASLALEGEEPVGLLQTPQPRELSPESSVVTQETEPTTPVVIVTVVSLDSGLRPSIIHS